MGRKDDAVPAHRLAAQGTPSWHVCAGEHPCDGMADGGFRHALCRCDRALDRQRNRRRVRQQDVPGIGHRARARPCRAVRAAVRESRRARIQHAERVRRGGSFQGVVAAQSPQQRERMLRGRPQPQLRLALGLSNAVPSRFDCGGRRRQQRLPGRRARRRRSVRHLPELSRSQAVLGAGDAQRQAHPRRPPAHPRVRRHARPFRQGDDAVGRRRGADDGPRAELRQRGVRRQARTQGRAEQRMHGHGESRRRGVSRVHASGRPGTLRDVCDPAERRDRIGERHELSHGHELPSDVRYVGQRPRLRVLAPPREPRAEQESTATSTNSTRSEAGDSIRLRKTRRGRTTSCTSRTSWRRA